MKALTFTPGQNARVKGLFSALQSEPYALVSEDTREYNCVAFAAEDLTKGPWDPTHPYRYWPRRVPRNDTLAAYRQVFFLRGYQDCVSSAPEEGYEKIAIYVDKGFGLAQHVAKQLPNGMWVSKLGFIQDIEHTLRGLEGPEPAYGRVALIMRRRTRRRRVA